MGTPNYHLQLTLRRKDDNISKVVQFQNDDLMKERSKQHSAQVREIISFHKEFRPDNLEKFPIMKLNPQFQTH